MSITAQLSPSFTPLASSAGPSGRSGTLMAARYSEHWHETGLNELFSVLFCFFFPLGCVIIGGELIGSGRAPMGALHTIFRVMAKLPQQGQLCWDARSCGVCECVCLCIRERERVYRVLGGGVEGLYMVEKDTSEQPEIPLLLWNFFFFQAVLQEIISIVENLGDFTKRSFINIEAM